MLSIKKILLSFALCIPICGNALDDEPVKNQTMPSKPVKKPPSADEQTKNQMLADLGTIKNYFELHYAPAEWKKEYCSWDLNDEIQKAKDAILNTENITTKDYQKIVAKLFNSTRDHHVKVVFYSTEYAYLPFNVIGINDKYFISYIDSDKFSPAFRVSEGDELVMFDQKPIGEAVKKIQMDRFGTSEAGTDRALAELLLTQRIAALGHDVPNGPVSIQIRSKDNNALKSLQLSWTYTPEKITNHMAAGINPKKKSDRDIKNHPFFNKMLIAPFYDFLTAEDHENCFAIGARKSFIPSLGNKWWETSEDCPYYAYLYETPDHRRIGYLRIPLYLVWSPDELASILSFFDQMTDALVIDQINNPGGYIWEMYAILSMLTDHALFTPHHRVAITYDDIEFVNFAIPELEKVQSDEDAVDLLGSTIAGYPVNYQHAQFFLNYCRFILNEWNAGKILSSPTHLQGVDQINPHPIVQYAKPILLLVNHLDFSGGDFFPGIMQDNKRATIMGTKTAGAGGYISYHSFSNRFGIDFFRLTSSIAYRIDQKPLENLGVTPDILYEITEDDFKNGYRGYIKAIQNAIDNLTK